MPYKEGPVHNKTEEGEGRRTRSGGVPPNRVEIRAGVIQTREGGQSRRIHRLFVTRLRNSANRWQSRTARLR